MLSRQEQQVWDDVQRFWAAEVEEPPQARPPTPSPGRRASRDRAVLQVAVVLGARMAIVLLLFGALVPGLAVGVATMLGWALSRCWPPLGAQGELDASPHHGGNRTVRRPADEPGNRRLPPTWNAD